MQLQVTMDVSAATARLGQLADEQLDGALARGVLAAAVYAAGEAQLLAAERLESRSGQLLSQIGAWADEAGADGGARGAARAYFGVPEGARDPAVLRYAWLLTGKDKVIRPVGHKYLAIPIGRNRTKAGIGNNLYASPREIPRELIQWRGRTVGIGVGDDYEPMFALTPEVHIFGRDVLEDVVESAAGEMAAIVQDEVDRVLAG